jgi:hypothetical protein
MLEVLHRFLVLLRGAPRGKRSEIAPFPGLGVLFPRVQTIFSGF